METAVNGDQPKKAHYEAPVDVTSRGVRSRNSYFPERLWNAEKAQAVLHSVLVERKSLDPILFKGIQTMLLFGRKGSGKNTILHTRDPEQPDRFLYLDSFDKVVHWKMRSWNYPAFLPWAAGVIKSIGAMKDPKCSCLYEDKSLLIVIQDVHLLSNLRDPVYMNTFTHIMTAIRMAPPETRDSIRLVMTCSDIPSIFPQEFRQLVDQEIYVPLPTPAHCRAMIIDWLRLFRSLCSREPRLQAVTWSVELGEDDLEDDPDHVVNLLSLACAGVTPRELYAFMQRINGACSSPQPDGSTDVNGEFLEKMLYNTEIGKSVVPYSTEKENSAINKFLGIDFASAAGVAQGNPLTVANPLAQKILAPSINKKRKKDQAAAPLNETLETLKEQATERAKILKGVERRNKAKQQEKRARDDEEEDKEEVAE